MDYDSEREDRLRRVLDTAGDFTLHGQNPDERPVIFKLHEFKPMVQDRSGNLVPFKGVVACRPVPSPASVSRARKLMGEGEHGVWTATKFHPPSDSSNAEVPPDEVFRLRKINCANPNGLGLAFLDRFCIRRRFVPAVSGLKTMCVFTDGACLHNGSTDTEPKGGAAFVFKNGEKGEVSFALENKGVDGQVYRHTSSRAELRAVLAALTFRVWWGEGWERIVIVTDSEYVGIHVTGSLRTWASRGWRVGSGKAVANKDLWQELSKVMGLFAEAGCEISFWTVPRRMNVVADRAAKAAAERGNGSDSYTVTHGVLV